MCKKAKMSYGGYSTEFGPKALKSREFNAKNAQIFVWDPILEPRLFKKHKSKKKPIILIQISILNGGVPNFYMGAS
jgi:hypothetical protein